MTPTFFRIYRTPDADPTAAVETETPATNTAPANNSAPEGTEPTGEAFAVAVDASEPRRLTVAEWIAEWGDCYQVPPAMDPADPILNTPFLEADAEAAYRELPHESAITEAEPAAKTPPDAVAQLGEILEREGTNPVLTETKRTPAEWAELEGLRFVTINGLTDGVDPDSGLLTKLEYFDVKIGSKLEAIPKAGKDVTEVPAEDDAPIDRDTWHLIKLARKAEQEAEADVASLQKRLKSARERLEEASLKLGQLIDESADPTPFLPGIKPKAPKPPKSPAAEPAPAAAEEPAVEKPKPVVATEASEPEPEVPAEAWQKVVVDDLALAPALTKKIKDAGIDTIGALAKYTEERPLTSIPGVTKAWAKKIEAALGKLWATLGIDPPLAKSDEPVIAPVTPPVETPTGDDLVAKACEALGQQQSVRFEYLGVPADFLKGDAGLEMANVILVKALPPEKQAAGIAGFFGNADLEVEDVKTLARDVDNLSDDVYREVAKQFGYDLSDPVPDSGSQAESPTNDAQA